MTLTAHHPADTQVPAEALFKEARRRRHRRQLGWLVLCLLAAVAATVSFSQFGSQRAGHSRQLSPSKTAPFAATPKEIVGWMRSRLVVIATNGGNVVRTLASNVSVFAPGFPTVSVSPDGLVFFDSTPLATIDDDHDSGDQIFSVPISGGPVREVTAGSDPEVSPNGRLLAFIGSDPTGEAPYLVPPVGIDVATLSSEGSIDNVRTLAPAAAQLGQGASNLSWSADSRNLSFALLNPSTNTTTPWTVPIAGNVRSLSSARQIRLRQPGLTWNGYWGTIGSGAPRGLGILTSPTRSQEVVTINPSTGQVASRLFDAPAEVCVSDPSSTRDGCFSDFSNPVIGDGSGNGVLLAGTVPLDYSGRGISPQEQYLYVWKLGEHLPVRLARQVLTAAWGQS
jgi:hypothetical protein